MFRTIAFLSAVFSAAVCQAGILSQLTLTYQSQTEPTSVASGRFGVFAVNGLSDYNTVTPFAANTDYYVPLSQVENMYYMVTHPAQFETHGSMWLDMQGAGLGLYDPHYDRLDEDFTTTDCSQSFGSCTGNLTVDGTPQAYTVPWNEIKMRYSYTPQGGSYITNMVVTISNVPEPATLSMFAIALSAVGIRARWLRRS